MDALQTPTIVSMIVRHLTGGDFALINALLVNKCFYKCLRSHLLSIHTLRLENVSTEKQDDESDSWPAKALAINGVVHKSVLIAKKNIAVMVANSPIRTLRLEKLEVDPVFFSQTAIPTMLCKVKDPNIIHFPKDINYKSSNALALLLARVRKADALLRVPFCFFGAISEPVHVRHLHMDMRCIRFGAGAISDDRHKSWFYQDALLELHRRLESNVVCEHLTWIGYNNARFIPEYAIALKSFGVERLEMLPAEPSDFSDDLAFFQEWRNRNKIFDGILRLKVVLSERSDASFFEKLVPMVRDVFVDLAELELGLDRALPDLVDTCETLREAWSALRSVDFGFRVTLSLKCRAHGKSRVDREVSRSVNQYSLASQLKVADGAVVGKMSLGLDRALHFSIAVV